MRHILYLLFTCFCIQSALSQESAISGRVIGAADNQPLEGVTVTAVVPGAGRIQALTNRQGFYTIKVPATVKELTFTYTGMTTLTERISAGHALNVQLLAGTNQLEQVVVTALGIRREVRALSYSQQKMDVGNMSEAPTTNLVSALSGKVAGLQIIPPSSNSGSARVVIRGNNSISGNNQPLFVVDGIPVDNSPGDQSVTTSGNTNLDYGNIAANINPEDIENIEVLKGPNAAALYGSRAANGAIIITTRKASANRFKVTYNANLSFQTINELPDYQNVFGAGNSYKLEGSGSTSNPQRLPNEKVFNRSWGAPMLGQQVIGIDGQVKPYLPEPDNITDFYQTAKFITNSLAVEGGSNQNNYRFSYTNFNSNSVVGGIDKTNRHTVNLRVTNNIAKWLNLDSKVSYIRSTVTNRQYMNGSTRNPIYQYAFMIRDIPLDVYQQYKDANGNEANTHTDFLNPYWAINEDPNEDVKDQVLSSFNANINFTNWLKLTARLGMEMYWWDGYEFNNKGSQSDPDGFYKSFNNKLNNLNADVILTADKKFGDFSLTTFAGAGRFSSLTNRRSQQINSLIQAGLKNMSN